MSKQENITAEADTGPKTMSQDDISSLIAELAGDQGEETEKADDDSTDTAAIEASGAEAGESDPSAANAVSDSETDVAIEISTPESEGEEASEIEGEKAPETEGGEAPETEGGEAPETEGEEAGETDAAAGAESPGADVALEVSTEATGDADAAEVPESGNGDAPKTMSQGDISSLIAELSGKKEEDASEAGAEDHQEGTGAGQTPVEEENEAPPEGITEVSAPEAAASESPIDKPPQSDIAAVEGNDKKDQPEALDVNRQQKSVRSAEAPQEKGPPLDDSPQAKEADHQKSAEELLPKERDDHRPPAVVENTEQEGHLKEKDPDQVKADELKKEIGALLEAGKSKPRKSRKKLGLSLLAAVLMLAAAGVAGGYFLYYRTPGGRVSEPLPTVSPQESLRVIPTQVLGTDGGPEKTIFQFEVEEPARVSGGKLDSAMNLRDELLIKNTEIEGLKQYYQGGIADMENEIQGKIVREGIDSLPSALKHRDVQYLLQAIQRRQAYIKGLAAPSRWVEYGSEELLYIHRKATIETMMQDVVSGINLNEIQAEIADVINKYQMDSDKLGMEAAASDLQPIEEIWRRIYARSRNTDKNQGVTNAAAATKNQAIWKEICSGNYDRKYELTAISPAAAKCLAKSSESDLFLNNITQLSPEAAKHLFEWKGNWLCLNGFKELNPGVARHLFQWEGSWMSLNGVSEISVDAARQLSEWPGRQIELMGLKYDEGYMRQSALKYLAKWKAGGGKLYVPGKIEHQIDKLLVQK